MAIRRRRRVPRRAPQRRAQDTSEKILAAALEAFADLGFDGARTRDIAARAGVNQGLITYHFASKLELWKAAVDRIFALLAESLGGRLRALEGVDAPTRLRLALRDYVRFAAAHPELHRLMVEEGKNDGPRMEWLVDRHVRPLYESSRALIDAAQAEGSLPRLPPLHLHYMLIGAAAHLFVMAPECRRLTGKDPMRKDAIEAHADAIVALVLGPAASQSKRATQPRRGAAM